MKYATMHCLFHPDDSCLEDLYPANFTEADLSPEVFSARRVTDHLHYKMVRCKHSGLIFSREVLPPDVLEDLYSKSKVTFTEYTDIIRQDYWKPLSELSVLKKGTALEIGCSSGFFLEELLSKGFAEVYGCEPAIEAVNYASPQVKKRIFQGIFKEDIFPELQFDLICCFQTLDHLQDPGAVLRSCYSKLKEGGLLYIVVHNTEALQARIFGEKSPIIDIEHIYLFNRKALSLLAQKAGFKIIHLFSLRNSYPLKYWINHSPLPLKKLIYSMVDFFGLAKRRLPLKAGNMGIILQK